MACVDRYAPHADDIHRLLDAIRALDAAAVERLVALSKQRIKATPTALMQAVRRATIAARLNPHGTNAQHDAIRALIDHYPEASTYARAALSGAAIAIALDLVLSDADVELLLRPWRTLETERAVAGGAR